jgi:hypothetical protein
VRVHVRRGRGGLGSLFGEDEAFMQRGLRMLALRGESFPGPPNAGGVDTDWRSIVRDVIASLSEDEVFGEDRGVLEPVDPVRREVDGRAAVEQLLSDCLADGR